MPIDFLVAGNIGLEVVGLELSFALEITQLVFELSRMPLGEMGSKKHDL